MVKDNPMNDDGETRSSLSLDSELRYFNFISIQSPSPASLDSNNIKNIIKPLFFTLLSDAKFIKL